MITKDEADQLRALITQYRDAEIADSWKSYGASADRPEIEADLAEAKHELEMFIHVLEHGAYVTPEKIQ